MNILIKALIVSLFAVHSGAQVLDMNDISILLPVPKVGEENLLIKSSDLTRSGAPLFPAESLFVGFELDIGMRSRGLNQTEGFRVIGIRLDHFVGQLYINLVFQKPINGGIFSQASIHSGHTIQELPLFLNKLEELNRKFKRGIRQASQPLQVNPTIKAQGLQGAYYQELKKIILSHINPANKVTFRSFRRSDWASGFAGWELPINKGQPSVNQFLSIPEFQPVQEPFRNWQTYVPGNYFEIKNKLLSNILTVGGLAPYKTLNFQPLIEDAERASKIPEQELLEMVGRVHMVENPKIIPGVVKTECLSCHFAQPIRHNAKKFRPNLPFEKFAERVIYTSNQYNLQNLSPAQKTNLTMAFGYAENTAVWNQRVINETADTLETLYRSRGILSSNRILGAH